jgi:hypothetical protein
MKIFKKSDSERVKDSKTGKAHENLTAMPIEDNVEVAVVPEILTPAITDYEQAIFDLDANIDLLSSHADALDYLVSVASGVLCASLDILWVGEFSLSEGREIAREQVDGIVKKTANLLGCKDDDISSCVAFLEKKFPLPADGNTPDFGGGLQHHLRDFAHHPTLVGLIFSLLTQFTGMSYGTNTAGQFIIVPVPEKSRIFIGEDIPDKLLKGTVIWFFHLVSDVAGSSSTAGLGGGTGIPGPILSLAKELSVLPGFIDLKIEDNSLSVFLSKLFNGTLFAQHDEKGKIIKDTAIRFDLRSELGVLVELGKQAVPVIANECIVRLFYFIRRLAMEVKDKQITSLSQFSEVSWERIKPYNNPTLTRMLTISTGVFTAVDITEAVVTQKYWISVNYVGVGRFAVALGAETASFLKIRNVSKIKQMYEEIQRNTYNQTDNRIYSRIGEDIDMDRFGLTIEQTEILFNFEHLKTLNDIAATMPSINREKTISLKQEWLDEWKHYMEIGFSRFVGDDNACLHWYSLEELIIRISENDPSKPWLRLAFLEAMLFEPYYPLSTEKDKKGNDVPSKRYNTLKTPIIGYRKDEGDKFLNSILPTTVIQPGYVTRLRKCYNKVSTQLNEVLKNVLKGVSITAIVTIVAVVTAGAFAPAIAVALVGSQFAGLSGAALTSACLAYLGGGAIAIGGAGMAGGTAAVVGGGALLGLTVGAGVGSSVGAAGIVGKKATILQSAKLMVATREIFLNDEHDLEYSNTIYEQYVRRIADIEKGLVELRLKADVADKGEKKRLLKEIKNAEESVEAMKIARKSMLKFNSSFMIGLEAEEQ